MFDEQHLINQCVKRIKKETRPTITQQTAFNQSLDRRLKKLVFLYKFNFEAIALHLIEEFPQFQYKICKASVAFRWHQIMVTPAREKESEIVDQGIQGEKQKNLNLLETCLKKRNRQSSSQQSESEELQVGAKEDRLMQKEKRQNTEQMSQLQRVLQQARELAENQSSCFIAYKPNYNTHQSRPAATIELHKESESDQEGGSKKVNEEQNTTHKEEDDIDYEYGYNYRQLEQEYNHYNQVVNLIGYGFHDDSATDESGDSSQDQASDNDDGIGSSEQAQSPWIYQQEEQVGGQENKVQTEVDQPQELSQTETVLFQDHSLN